MPIALIVALVGSLALHGAALFGTDVELFGAEETAPAPLVAEIKALPKAPESAVLPAAPVVKKRKPPVQQRAESAPVVAPPPAAPEVEAAADLPPEMLPEITSTATIAAPEPAKPLLPASGVIRFAIYKESLGLQVGRAEHRWEFTEDGRYRLRGLTETSGLAALLKPVRLEVESSGRLVAGGLQPETFRSLKNGRDANENADFDWSTATLQLSRDGSVQSISPGTQDILSLNYQLAYLKKPENGATIGVVTGKKYERYNLDSLGEEELELPAGRFRTLHLRAQTTNTTEIWIALDHQRLPVKIRFTDKKGESFEQVATELGMP